MTRLELNYNPTKSNCFESSTRIAPKGGILSGWEAKPLEITGPPLRAQFDPQIISPFCRYMNPVFCGDYPEVMREKLGNRLPKFTDEEIEMVRGSVDFIGVNHYTTRFIAHTQNSTDECNFYKDQEMDRIGNYSLNILTIQVSAIHLSGFYLIYYDRSMGRRRKDWWEGICSLTLLGDWLLYFSATKWDSRW